MKVSEFIRRLQELQEVAGDVDVVVETEMENLFETAAAECQNVVPDRLGSIGVYRALAKNTHVVIKVW